MNDNSNENKEEVEETSTEFEQIDSENSEDYLYHEEDTINEESEETEIITDSDDTEETQTEEETTYTNDVSGNDPSGSSEYGQITEVAMYDTNDYTSYFQNLEVLSILQLTVLIALGVAICFCKGFDKK